MRLNKSVSHVLSIPTYKSGMVWPSSFNSRPFFSNCLLRKSATNLSIRTSERKGEMKTTKDFSQVPGPKRMPLIGSSLSVFFHPEYNPSQYHKFWDSMVKEYGPVIRMKLPTLPNVICTADANNAEIIMKSTLHDPQRTFFGSLKKARKLNPDPVYADTTGLLTENNEDWWKLRSKVQPYFLHPKHVLTHLPVINDVAEMFLKRIDVLQADTGVVPDNFLEELYRWALESVGTVAFGTEFGLFTDKGLDPNSKEMQFLRHIMEMFSGLNDSEMGIHIWQYFRNSAFRRLQQADSDFVRIGTEKIRELKEARKLEMKEQNKCPAMIEKLKKNETLTESHINTVILDMLFAGMDTTAHSLAFALYLVAKHPEVQEKLYNEVQQVMGPETDVTSSYLAETKYAYQIVRETLRLYPLTLGTGRLLHKDTVLSGYTIPAGTLAYTLNMQLSRNPKYFRRADEFLPDRWAEERPHGPIHQFSSLPFAHGKRVCIGKRIALQEIQTLLIKMIQKYKIELPNEQEMKIKTQVVIKPDIPLNFKFVKRNSN